MTAQRDTGVPAETANTALTAKDSDTETSSHTAAKSHTDTNSHTAANSHTDTNSHTARPGRAAILATRPLMGWRGIDLITAAMLAVAFGVMFWGFDTLIYPILSTATAGFPPAGELMLGIWLIPAVVAALVIRRPGAALFTELVAANVELYLGNKWGAAVLLSAVLQGMGVELALALFRHRRFGVVVAVLGGVLAAAFEIVFYEWHSYVAEYSLAWKAIYLGCGMVSGALVAGVGSWALVRGLAGTGALNAFPPGQEVRESHLV